MFRSNLGLQLARLADLPKDVLVEAEKVARHLSEGSMLGDENSESSKVAKRRKIVLKVVLRLLSLNITY